ncbi:MAG: DUF1732 domain-containing protein, partial [Candidatus Riflebacteria bacterium]|nr:DUF1732 domain-containing protein [Candidatus Riflebacteria bacterium]
RGLKVRYNLKGDLVAEDLLFAPSVVSAATEIHGKGELLQTTQRLVRQALDRMEEMQVAEGATLAADLTSRASRLQQLVEAIRERVPQMVSGYRKSLEGKIRDWKLDALMPPERLALEVSMFADRSDVTEELVRIESHLAQVRAAFAGGGEVGHKLDFLAQECGREINTIGSKSQSADISGLVVQFKEELSRIREQLQNLV